MLHFFDYHFLANIFLSGCPQCHPDLNALLTFANKRCHTKKCNFDSSYLCQTLPVAKFQPNMSPAGVWLVGPVHLLELIHLVLLAHQHPVQQKSVRFTICFFFLDLPSCTEILHYNPISRIPGWAQYSLHLPCLMLHFLIIDFWPTCLAKKTKWIVPTYVIVCQHQPSLCQTVRSCASSRADPPCSACSPASCTGRNGRFIMAYILWFTMTYYDILWLYS